MLTHFHAHVLTNKWEHVYQSITYEEAQEIKFTKTSMLSMSGDMTEA